MNFAYFSVSSSESESAISVRLFLNKGLNTLSKILSFSSPFDRNAKVFKNGSSNAAKVSKSASANTLLASAINISVIYKAIP